MNDIEIPAKPLLFLFFFLHLFLYLQQTRLISYSKDSGKKHNNNDNECIMLIMNKMWTCLRFMRLLIKLLIKYNKNISFNIITWHFDLFLNHCCLWWK